MKKIILKLFRILVVSALIIGILISFSLSAIWDNITGVKKEKVEEPEPPLYEQNITFAEKIAKEKNKFRQNEYFAGNAFTGENLTKSSHTLICENCTWNGSCYPYCNDLCGTYYIEGTENGMAWQCYAYACQIGYDIFGIDPYRGWYRHYDVYSIVPGDMVRFSWSDEKFDPHVIFVLDVVDGTVYFTDSNSIGPCQINWEGTMSLKKLEEYLQNFQDVYTDDDGNEQKSRVGVFHSPNNESYDTGVVDINADGKHTAADVIELRRYFVLGPEYWYTEYNIYLTTSYDMIVNARDSIILNRILETTVKK